MINKKHVVVMSLSALLISAGYLLTPTQNTNTTGILAKSLSSKTPHKNTNTAEIHNATLTAAKDSSAQAHVLKQAQPTSTQTLSAAINLWSTNPDANSEYDDVAMEHVIVNMNEINQLTLHSPVNIQIPQAGQIYSGSVINVSHPVSGVDELTIELDNMEAIYRMSLSRGELASYGWITTPGGIFNIEINHQTAEGTITNNDSLLARYPLDNDYHTAEEPEALALPEMP